MSEQIAPPFVNRPEISETFADGIDAISAGAGVVSIALTVTRTEQGNPPTFSRVLSHRLVMTLPAAAALYQRLGAMLTTLQNQAQKTPAIEAPIGDGAKPN